MNLYKKSCLFKKINKINVNSKYSKPSLLIINDNDIEVNNLIEISKKRWGYVKPLNEDYKENYEKEDDEEVKLKKKRWGFIAPKSELPNNIPIFSTTNDDDDGCYSEDDIFYNYLIHLLFKYY